MKTALATFCRGCVTAVLGWLLLAGSVLAQGTQTPSLCTAKGYTVGFFNGVWNDEAGALSGLAALRDLIGPTYQTEPVRYESFLNTTGSDAAGTFMQDIAETFIQRAREIDSSGELEQRWELLWEVAFDSRATFWERIRSTVTSAGGTLQAFYTDVVSKSIAGWAQLLSTPPTGADLARHRARLDALALEGQKLILVAHSQGNLFVNEAYDYVRPKVGASSVAAVHIAPASPTLRGAYKLADIDLIINGLRAQGIGSVPPVNLSLSASLSDPTGHMLVGTYLDVSRPGRAAVFSMISSSLQSLTTPTGNQAGQASQGFFTVTLTWNGSGDVDLHTFEPNGAHVYYQQLQGAAGRLDVDNVTANGPEHYFASCDPNVLLPGTYRIGINNFSGATGRTATVQVAGAQRGELLTRTLGVGSERGSSGNSTPIPVFTVNVKKDPDTGVFSVSAQ